MAEKYNNISRTKDWNQNFENIRWESSAYHEVNLWVPDGDGRIYFDTMWMVKRDYKEDSYQLDALCQKYLGIGKHEWSPEDIFKSFREDIPENLRKTVAYCIRDVWCTWGLFNHFGFWTSYCGMSNIMGISIFDLFSRGQQLRTITQLFKECHRNGYYLHAPERINRSIAGGYVFPQVPGLYEYVLLLDFEGLYPSIMRRYNISNDTFDFYGNAKDEDCFIFNWTDEHGDWKTRFVKPHLRKGLIPTILEKLYNARNVAKAKMEACKKAGDKRGAMVYNVEQLANKLSGNSIYGGVSQKGGKLSLSEAGAAVTAYGRMSVQKAGAWVTERGYEVIYGDTDSIFIRKKGELTLEEKMNFKANGEKLAAELNAACFTMPMRMQVDGMYRTMHSISKKMYQMIKLDEKKPLEINPELWSSKGLVTAKRDCCKMIRNLYKKTAVMISCMKDFYEVISVVASEIERLLFGKLDILEMISIRKLGKGYTNKNAELPIYQKHLHERGMNVQPGDRLPFVYAKRDYQVQHQGEKWEDPDIFIREGLEYDRIQYLKSQFQNKLDTLLHTAFPDIVPKEFIAKVPNILLSRPQTDIMMIFAAIIDAYTSSEEKDKVEVIPGGVETITVE
jgi:DNA polymerase delta subunit 1